MATTRVTTLDETSRYAKSPGESVQEILRRDRILPRECFLESSYQFLGDEDISVERYVSPEWHAREVEKVWRKTWQVACRVEDIPNAGDYLVYDVVDDSVLVTRLPDGTIRAYVNVCLHRGNKLCVGQGRTKAFRCPFHGFTWSLEGRLRWFPGDWDFPHLERDKFHLPEVAVATWGGFVFVNLDAAARPLEEYLEILPQHLESREFENRYKAAHVSRIVPCNWKIAQEAFIEGYHVAETHYSKDDDGRIDPFGIPAFTHDTAVQYDVWPGIRHVNRLILVDGVPSQYVARQIKDEQQIVDAMLRRVPAEARPKLQSGEKARPVLADFNRKALATVYRIDLSKAPDSEVLDQVQYNLFPNFTVWPTVFAPLCYRFRPYGNDPNQSIFEVWFLHPRPEWGDPPVVASERRLAPDESWASARELGVYGPIIDQDMPNLARLQQGLRATRKLGITLGNYQEIRIRHFHQTLEQYLRS